MWAVPQVTDAALFEHLTLGGAQAGLSWATILAKRAAYTRCFKQWDIPAIAAMARRGVGGMTARVPTGQGCGNLTPITCLSQPPEAHARSPRRRTRTWRSCSSQSRAS